MTERWLPVPGYEATHEVSDLGRVRSLSRLNTRGFKRKGKILSTGPNQFGYEVAQLYTPGKVRRAFFVHRLVLTAFVGPCPPGMEGCHGPGGKRDNRLSNLRWDTSTANALDKRKHGSQTFGDDHPVSKLTASKVREARDRRLAGESYAAIARDFNVTYQAICDAIKKKTWAHVQ